MQKKNTMKPIVKFKIWILKKNCMGKKQVRNY